MRGIRGQGRIRTIAATQTELLSHMLPHVRLWQAGDRELLYISVSQQPVGLLERLTCLCCGHPTQTRMASQDRGVLPGAARVHLLRLPGCRPPRPIHQTRLFFVCCSMAVLSPECGGGEVKGRARTDGVIRGVPADVAEPRSRTKQKRGKVESTVGRETSGDTRAASQTPKMHLKTAHQVRNCKQHSSRAITDKCRHRSPTFSQDSWRFTKETSVQPVW